VELLWAFQNLTPLALLDIFLVAALIFGVSFLFRGTQSGALMRGTIVFLVAMLVISRIFQLSALRWLFENMLTFVAVAIPVIFQPELRRALEGLGRAGMPFNRQAPESVRVQIIESICQASERLSERRHGALIVLQRSSNLEDYVRTGILLNSDVTSQLLLTIFWPKTELHDGAAIIDSRGCIASAASVLPLTASRNLPGRKLGTRHRAALGISEVSDAICVVVSEETGRISITHGGRMIMKLDTNRLRTILQSLYSTEQYANMPPWTRLVARVQSVFRPNTVE
jgi:diadenylate cyclase